MKRYGEELTIDRANKILLMRSRDRPLILKLRRQAQSLPKLKDSGIPESCPTCGFLIIHYGDGLYYCPVCAERDRLEECGIDQEENAILKQLALGE